MLFTCNLCRYTAAGGEPLAAVARRDAAVEGGCAGVDCNQVEAPVHRLFHSHYIFYTAALSPTTSILDPNYYPSPHYILPPAALLFPLLRAKAGVARSRWKFMKISLIRPSVFVVVAKHAAAAAGGGAGESPRRWAWPASYAPLLKCAPPLSRVA